MAFKKGQNPRAILERHRERGPKRFEYTYEDLADLFGMSRGALRVAVSRKQVDPESMNSIVEFYIKRNQAALNEGLKDLVEEARALMEED